MKVTCILARFEFFLSIGCPSIFWNVLFSLLHFPIRQTRRSFQYNFNGMGQVCWHAWRLHLSWWCPLSVLSTFIFQSYHFPQICQMFFKTRWPSISSNTCSHADKILTVLRLCHYIIRIPSRRGRGFTL